MVNPICINGVGMIAACGQSVEEVLLAAAGEKKDFALHGEKEFQSPLPSSKVRRCPRYTKMAAACAALASNDGRITNPEKTGTIISTGYGAVESNITFADSVVKGDPALCSPSVFSSTVPNSCVGQICIINGYKGFSTILTAGDPMEYSALLLNSNRAETILCGAVEEYNEDLEAAVVSAGYLDACMVSEGAAMLVLSGNQTEETYCSVSAFSSASLPKYPYIHPIDIEEAEAALTETFREIASVKTPDLILTQANGTYFDSVERKALKNVFGNGILTAEPKKIFGETFGGGYLLNVALGASILKKKEYPAFLFNEQSDGREIQCVLAAGLDTHGNYLTVLLEG